MADPDRSFSLQPDEVDIQSITRYSSQREESPSETIKKFEVKFDGENDPENAPAHMSYARKWFVTLLLAATSICVTLQSSAWSMVSEKIIAHFNISREVSILGISLFIWGLGFGPIILSPISEFYGRKVTYIFGLSLCSVFQILIAFSPNIGALLFGRFMAGFFGSAFLSVSGGTVTDTFEKHEIGVPMCVFTLAPFIAPTIGPIYSAAVNSHLYWRWTFYILLIYSAALLTLVILFVPETYAPVLLIKKAKRIRKETGDDRYYAPLELLQKEQSIFKASLTASQRPFLLMYKDRMIFILCCYTGIALAIIYLFFVSNPYVYGKVFHFNDIAKGLSFLGLLIGMLVGGVSAPYFQNVYNRKVQETGAPQPEFRLYPLMIGGFLGPIGLLIFAWTSYSRVHWIGSMVGTAIFGTGVALIFQGVFGYTTDAYRLYSASAMACNSLIRSTLSGVFPLFGIQMYERVGPNWGSTILGALMVLMIPFPFIFYKVGASLRKKSPFTWSMD